jgi:glycosyltransferase involved in cell wall biosynthesis
MTSAGEPAAPRVSVIIPAHNAERFLDATLQSVLAQTLRPFEVIVVNDGSDDRTAQVVAELGAPGIRCITQPKSGVSAARNRGLDEARGEFIAFLDADDLWRPDMLTRHTSLLLSRQDAVFSFSDFQRFDHETGAIMGTQFAFYRELDTVALEPLRSDEWLINRNAFVELVRFGEFPAFTQAMLFRRSLIDDLRFDETLSICEDAHFVLRAALRGAVGVIGATLVNVRRHGNNATSDRSGMALDKLNALLHLQPSITEPEQRGALEERIARAHLEVARQHLHRGSLKLAIQSWRAALATGAAPVLKIRWTLGLVRVGIFGKRDTRVGR